MSWRKLFCSFSAEILYDLDKKNQSKCKISHVKFHQIWTLIYSFCWKYIKFQLKTYGIVMPHGTQEGCNFWTKTDLLFQKRQKFGEAENLMKTRAPIILKISTLIRSFCAKYITFDLKKVQRSSLLWHKRVTQNLTKNWFLV